MEFNLFDIWRVKLDWRAVACISIATVLIELIKTL